MAKRTRSKKGSNGKDFLDRKLFLDFGPPKRIVLETGSVSLTAVVDEESEPFENRAYCLTFSWRPRNLVLAGSERNPVRGHIEYLLEVMEDRFPEVLS